MTVLLFYIPTRNGLEKVADKFFFATVQSTTAAALYENSSLFPYSVYIHV